MLKYMSDRDSFWFFGMISLGLLNGYFALIGEQPALSGFISGLCLTWAYVIWLSGFYQTCIKAMFEGSQIIARELQKIKTETQKEVDKS